MGLSGTKRRMSRHSRTAGQTYYRCDPGRELSLCIQSRQTIPAPVPAAVLISDTVLIPPHDRRITLGPVRLKPSPTRHINCIRNRKHNCMPDKKTIEAAKRDLKEGKSASTQAGEFVHHEIDNIRKGKHGARSAKQAIAI